MGRPERRTTILVVCACTPTLVGRISDHRATGGPVTVWSPVAPPQWKDLAVNTIRCAVCGKSAQLSARSAAAVAELLNRQRSLESVAVTDPDGHDRVLIQIRLDLLCAILGRLPTLRDT